MRKHLLLCLLALIAEVSIAQTRHWISTTTGNWNNAANWSATSGGTGGASVPGSTDQVFFNGNRQGDCVLDVAPTVAGITMNGYTGTLNLNGQTFTTTGANNFQTGNISNSGASAALVLNTTLNTTFRGTNVGVPVSGTSGDLYFNGSVFSGSVTVTKTSATTNTGTGGNTFGGALTLTNNGNADLILGNTNGDVFNGLVTINNSGTGRMLIAYNSPGNIFNAGLTINHGGNTDGINTIVARNSNAVATISGNIILNCTNASANSGIIIAHEGHVDINGNVTLLSSSGRGILFGGDNAGVTGTVTLGNGVTITAGGFTTGRFSMMRTTQTGTTAQSLSLGGTALLAMGPSNTLNGTVTYSAPQLQLNGGTYNGTTILEKTGATDNSGTGGNTFNGVTTITNTGSDELILGDGGPDVFNNTTVFNDNGSSRIRVAFNHAGQATTFTTDVTFRANKSSGTDTWSYLIGESTGTNVTFGGNVNVDIGGTLESDCRFLAGSGATSTIAGTLTFNVTNTHASTAISWGLNGSVLYNGDIVVNNTGGGSISLTAGASLTSTLAAGRTITIGAGGFSTGILSFSRFTQAGGTPQILNSFTGTARLTLGVGTTFTGTVDFRAPQIYLNGVTCNSTATIEKTGATNNSGTGGNTFNGVTTITNSGSGYLMTGDGSADRFNASTTFINNGAHRIYISQNHANQTTVFASDVTFNSSRTTGAENTSYTISDYPNSNISFLGNVTFNWGGTVESDLRMLGGLGATATYAGLLTVNSTNTNSGTEINLGVNGAAVYGGGVVVTNTGSITGIYFGTASTATATLPSGQTITIGGAGFTSGILSLARFTQVGTGTPQTLNTFSGTARLILGPASSFDGAVDFKAPQMNLSGTTFNGTTLLEKSGATGNASNGGNVFNNVTTITNSGPANFQLGNLNADSFNALTTFNNIGSSRIYVASSHPGQTTTFGADVIFNSNRSSNTDNWSYLLAEGTNSSIACSANCSFICAGTVQSDYRLLEGTGSTFSVAGTTTVSITNTSTATVMNMGTNGTSAYNGNIVVSNGGGGSSISFNVNSGSSSTLANGRTISIGVDGFIRGTLNLPRFTQVGNTSQLLTNMTGTSRLYVGPASTFNGNVDFKAPQLYLQGATYNGTATLEKSGATDNICAGGNIFNALTTITNSGSNELMLGNVTPDQFNAEAIFNNTGSSRFRLAYNHAGLTTTFLNDVTFNSNKTGGTDTHAFTICDGNNTSATFGGKVTMNIAGAVQSSFRTVNGVGTTITFGDILTVNCTNSNVNTAISLGTSGISTYNGDIVMSNSGGASGIFFNTTSTASSTLSNGRTVRLGAGNFTGGTLSFLRFTQVGATTQTLLASSAGTASLLVGLGSTFNGTVNFAAPQLFLNGATYNGTAIIEKTGAQNNSSNGGNTFNGTTTITNSGPGQLLLGTISADAFNAPATFNDTGSSRIYIAYSHPGQTTTFTDLALNAFKGSGADSWAFLISEGNSSNISVSGNMTINCGGTIRSDSRLLQGTGTTATYGGLVTVNVSNSNSATAVTLGATGTSVYNGNIVVTNNGGASGIFFNTGATASSTQAAGRTIGIGASGFTGGALQLIRFTQLGSAAVLLNTFSGTTTLTVGPSSAFGGNVTFVSPQLNSISTVYNGTAYLEKNGATASDFTGGNTFNGAATIVNSSAARLRMANTSGDAFNGAATFVKSSTGGLEPAYALTSTFAGNITTNANAQIVFGTGTGIVEFTGGSNQIVSKAASTVSPVFQRMRLNKTAGTTVTLNHDLTLNISATFTSGVMITTAANILNFADNATTTGANDLSYVDGPVRKTGNDLFVFPVGAGNFYRSIALAQTPANIADQFTAQYFKAGQTYGDKTKWDPSFYTVSGCEYWILDRTTGTSSVNVTLSWNEAACGTGYVTNPSTLRVTRWDNAQWVSHGNGGTTGTTAAGTITTSAPVSNFSPFTLASTTPANPLPIGLERFWAVNDTYAVTLRWTTVSETNNDHFTLQRSANGFDFETIYTVRGAGTSTERIQYSHTDDGPLAGQSYYRLVQTDYDGRSESWLAAVVRDGEDLPFLLSPNPAGNEIVNFNQRATVTILNNLGQVVGTVQETSFLDATRLAPGVYIVRNQKGQVARLVRK